MAQPQNTVESIWRRCRVGGEDECWPMLRVKADGYGRANLHGRRHNAHYVVYTLLHGPVPPGMVVMHTCDNPPCCNVRHLRLGTQADNVADMVAKGRHTHGESPLRGERHNLAKLTEADVREIRRRYAAGGVSLAQLAREHGVIRPTIGHIIQRRTWAHVA